MIPFLLPKLLQILDQPVLITGNAPPLGRGIVVPTKQTDLSDPPVTEWLCSHSWMLYGVVLKIRVKGWSISRRSLLPLPCCLVCALCQSVGLAGGRNGFPLISVCLFVLGRACVGYIGGFERIS